MLQADKALVVTARCAFRGIPFPCESGARLHVAPRLSIACGAVAILAVVANAITEHGSSIIRTIERGSIAAPLNEEQFDSEDILGALDRFQRAVLARVDSDDISRVKAHWKAAAALAVADETFPVALAPTLDDASLNELDAQVAGHRSLAVELVRAADSRWPLLRKFNVGLESLDAQMKTSLEEVGKIFGRVVARERLVDANRILDDMSKRAGALAVPQGYGQDTVRVIAASEAALQS